jgi:hypothetical protein
MVRKKGTKFSKRTPKWFHEIDPETDEPIESIKKEEQPKPKLNRAIISVLPKVYQRLEYTPQELRKKFIEYVQRSDENNEEITISWFQVYASTWRTYLTDKKECQDFSEVIEAIYESFEYRYEQKAARWQNMAYILNNRFKWKWESLQKNDNNLTGISQDVATILDKILNKSNGGETKV